MDVTVSVTETSLLPRQIAKNDLPSPSTQEAVTVPFRSNFLVAWLLTSKSTGEKHHHHKADTALFKEKLVSTPKLQALFPFSSNTSIYSSSYSMLRVVGIGFSLELASRYSFIVTPAT